MGQAVRQWTSVSGYEGLYEVSNFGEIRSIFRYKKLLKPSANAKGYLSVELWKNKVGKRLLVHRLVAKAFIPNPNEFPQVNHKDENPRNNNAENLEWCTALYNMNYGEGAKTRHSKIDYSAELRKEVARCNGKKCSKRVLQYSNVGELLSVYESTVEASVRTGVNRSHIVECANGKARKTAGGYIWKFDKERNVDLSDKVC